MDIAICPKCGKAELERKFSKIVEETEYTMTVDELYICPECGKEIKMKARHHFISKLTKKNFRNSLQE